MALESQASRLVPGDTNDNCDIFIRHPWDEVYKVYLPRVLKNY